MMKRRIQSLLQRSLGLKLGPIWVLQITFLARRFPKGKIVAFEPIPWNGANINRMINLFRLRNVSIQKCATGNQKA